ncbi:MAG: SRPBCC domain-containing protein, partial [Gammaproteobacteria bacterium]|nr:SRPBCC domain-containing protein [Gammaproteobacteria bacterium]
MKPDLSDRPLDCTVEATVLLSADVIYHAWTKAFDAWFAVEGSLIMSGEVGSTWFFETEMADK